MNWPHGPCHARKSSSNTPTMVANGCIMRRLPTSPVELARSESRSSRGVPMPFAHRIVTPARTSCSTPSASMYSAPPTSPSGRTVNRFTRARVRRSTPSSIARGQCVRSTVHLAPSAHACRHVPRCTHGFSAPYLRVAIASGAGHQCQPSSLCARATRRPAGPSGTGGSGGPSPGGNAVSPASPETPKSRSTRT